MYGTSNMRFYKRKPKITNTNTTAETASSEDILQRQIVAKFRAHNAFVILTDAVGPALKYISNNQMKMGFISWSKDRGWDKGVPDLIIIWKGSVLFLELKFKKGKLSPEQEIWKNRIISEGYEYACWRTLEECENWITNKLNNTGNK